MRYARPPSAGIYRLYLYEFAGEYEILLFHHIRFTDSIHPWGLIRTHRRLGKGTYVFDKLPNRRRCPRPGGISDLWNITADIRRLRGRRVRHLGSRAPPSLPCGAAMVGAAVFAPDVDPDPCRLAPLTVRAPSRLCARKTAPCRRHSGGTPDP